MELPKKYDPDGKKKIKALAKEKARAYKVGDKVRMLFAVKMFGIPRGSQARIHKVMADTRNGDGVYLVHFEPLKDAPGEEPLRVAFASMLEPWGKKHEN